MPRTYADKQIVNIAAAFAAAAVSVLRVLAVVAVDIRVFR